MDISIRDVRYFLAVVEAGSLGAASLKCFVTQPALSKSIARLEDILDQQLFVRSSNGMSLTGAGLQFLQHASRLSREHDETLRYASASREGLNGLVRIGSTRAVFDALLTDVLIEVQANAPGIRFELELSAADDLIESLLHGHLDMVLAPLKPHMPVDIDALALATDQVGVLARANHPVFETQDVSLNTLSQYPWILPKKNAAALMLFKECFAKARKPAPRPTIEVDYAGPSILRIVAATDCLLYVPGNWNMRQPDGLRRLPVEDLDSSRTIYLTTREGAYWSATMLKVRRTLESICANI